MTPAWPGGKRVAVAITVMVELWSEGKAPQYGPNTSSLKPDTRDYSRIAWSEYGAKEGAWRLLSILDQHRVPATFAPSARVLECIPEALKAARDAGHTIAAHSYTQDTILSELSPTEQRSVVQRCMQVHKSILGEVPDGWSSPIVSFTPETAGILVENGISWHVDIYDCDLPRVIDTPAGPIVGIPNSDFSDNRVLRGNPIDLFDVYWQTFDYLHRNEPGSLLTLAFHAHTGGRPLIAAQLDRLLSRLASNPDVWFARHGELARWALDNNVRAPRFAHRSAALGSE